MRVQARFAFCAALIVCSTLSARAHAAGDDEKTQCIAASDQGQQLRDDGKYRLAHEAFARCARPTCPAIVSRDCGVWLFDVDERSPTVIFAAVDDKGSDLSEVQVTVDGVPFAAHLTGLPAPVDPGDHLFRYEAAGFAPLEEHVTIKTGEKNRVLHVRLSPAAPVPPPVAPPPEEGVHASAGLRLPAWIFGGVAVAAFASEAYFGIAGLSQRSQDLSGPSKCAPNCSADEKSSIQTKFVIADVSLGVGALSLGLAAYFFVRSRQASHVVEASFDFAPRPGGGVATWGGRF